MNYLISFSIFVMLSTVFMLIRNRWIYKIQRRHNHCVSDRMRWMVDNNAVYSVEFQQECLASIYNYDKMFWHFWIWDLKGMVENKVLFDFVYGDSLERK